MGQFADSAGKKGGEFYTPRAVVRMLVRLIEPQEGMRVYDPCMGSGGLLFLSAEHVREHGGNPRNLGLFGQKDNGGVWSIAKRNLLLHGIADADLRHGDTLAEPLHTKDGELMRFDRVITNPPFSQNYSQDELPFKERFPYGFCPESGKKADLMFVQHMVAVLRPGGIVATVMPHGVLFRGGAERDIRRSLIEDDVLDAVIGLGPNLFYGTGIPACVLVLRFKGSKPLERQGKVLFINADAEYREGRAQNVLEPEHIEKIISAYKSFATIEGFAAVVEKEKLEAHNWNCNIRRYADNAPPPEPQDVRAHLLASFVEALTPLGLLDRFQVAGAVATWWGEVVFDLKALMAGGFAGVVESWVTTIVTALEEGGGKGAPLEHKLVQWLLPQFLDEIAEAEGRVAELDGTIKAATGSGEDEEGEGEAAEEDGLSEAEIKALKKDLSAAKKRLKSLIHSFELRLEEAQAELSPEKTEALVRATLRDELQRELERRVAAHREQVVAVVESWWEKYRVTLMEIEGERDAAKGLLDRFLEELGYVS